MFLRKMRGPFWAIGFLLLALAAAFAPLAVRWLQMKKAERARMDAALTLKKEMDSLEQSIWDGRKLLQEIQYSYDRPMFGFHYGAGFEPGKPAYIVVVRGVFRGGPADLAGVRAGQRILRVGNLDVGAIPVTPETREASTAQMDVLLAEVGREVWSHTSVAELALSGDGPGSVKLTRSLCGKPVHDWVLKEGPALDDEFGQAGADLDKLMRDLRKAVAAGDDSAVADCGERLKSLVGRYQATVATIDDFMNEHLK